MIGLPLVRALEEANDLLGGPKTIRSGSVVCQSNRRR